MSEDVRRSAEGHAQKDTHTLVCSAGATTKNYGYTLTPSCTGPPPETPLRLCFYPEGASSPVRLRCLRPIAFPFDAAPPLAKPPISVYDVYY